MDLNAPDVAYFVGPDGLQINHLDNNIYMGNARAVLPDGRVLHVRDPELWTVFDLHFDPAIRPNIFGRSRLRRCSRKTQQNLVDWGNYHYDCRVAHFIDPNGRRVNLTNLSNLRSDARLALPDGRRIHICDPYIWEIFDQHLNPALRPTIQGFQQIPFSGPPATLTSSRAHAPIAHLEQYENTNPWTDVAPRRRRGANMESSPVGQDGRAAESVPTPDKAGGNGGVPESKR